MRVNVLVSRRNAVPVRMVFTYLEFLLEFVHTFQFSLNLGQNDTFGEDICTYMSVFFKVRDSVLCDVQKKLTVKTAVI